MPSEERKFLEIPGNQIYELPPLCITTDVNVFVPQQGVLIEEIQDDGLMPGALDELTTQRALADLATNLCDRYEELSKIWYLGMVIMHWVEQCEITFSEIEALNFLLRPDLWPRADRKCVAELLVDKEVCNMKDLREAIGTHLTFRQLPPLDCFSDRFLLYLGPTIAEKTYETWAANSPLVSLPPDRFSFQVVNI
jgi:hypothetical protein